MTLVPSLESTYFIRCFLLMYKWFQKLFCKTNNFNAQFYRNFWILQLDDWAKGDNEQLTPLNTQCQDTKPHEKLVNHQHYLFKTISFVYFTRNGIVFSIYIFFQYHCHLLSILRINVFLCANGKFEIYVKGDLRFLNMLVIFECKNGK